MDQIAVFGIGSTNFRYAVAVPSGDIVTDVTVERTRPRDLESQLVSATDALTRQVDEELAGAAVSCTGLVNRDRNRINALDTPAGDLVDAVDVGAALRESHRLPVVVENDCNAAALGEWHFGSRDGTDTLVHVTIGTGIGGGVVDDGALFRGDSGQAGEFGLLPVAPERDVESTGVTGAWEAFCSGRGIAARVAERVDSADAETALPDDPSAQDVFRAAEAGDDLAGSYLETVDRYNAAGIGALCNAVNPGLVTIGGGVAMNNPDRIITGIDDHLDRFCFVDRPEIRISGLGDDIGLYGALAAFLQDRQAASPVWDRTPGTDVTESDD